MEIKYFLIVPSETQTSAYTVNTVEQQSGALTNALLDIWTTYGVNIKLKHLLWNIIKLLKHRLYKYHN